MKKICFITTSRADFGTLDELIKEVEKKNFFKVQLIISGSHINKIYGNTKNEIKIARNLAVRKIKINTSNKDSKSVALSFSYCVNKFSIVLSKLKPDLFVVFGDRYEMLAAAISAYILRIPIAHIAGGEKKIGKIKNYMETGCPLWGMLQLASKKKCNASFIKNDHSHFWGKNCKKNVSNNILMCIPSTSASVAITILL